MSRELEYFDALKKIARYQSVEWLRKNAERAYGLSPEEAVEMAYDNIQQEAKNATRGRKRPAV